MNYINIKTYVFMFLHYSHFVYIISIQIDCLLDFFVYLRILVSVCYV